MRGFGIARRSEANPHLTLSLGKGEANSSYRIAVMTSADLVRDAKFMAAQPKAELNSVSSGPATRGHARLLRRREGSRA